MGSNGRELGASGLDVIGTTLIRVRGYTLELVLMR